MTEEIKPDVAADEDAAAVDPNVDVKEPTAEEQLATAKSELEAANAKIKGYQNKDYNFKKLREMSDDEKSKMTETEMRLQKQAEKLEEDTREFTGRITKGHKDDAYAVLAGSDEELAKKMDHYWDKFANDPVTKADIAERSREVYNLAMGGKGMTVDPIARANAHYAGRGVVKESSKMTSDQMDLASRLGISSDDIKKHGNK